MLRPWFMIVLLIGLAAPAGRADERMIVKRADFACLAENAAHYQAARRFPVIVVFDKCPETDVSAEATMRQAQNSYYPRLSNSGTQSGTAIAEWLSMTRQELECVAGFPLDKLEPFEDPEYVYLPADLCGLD